jgi:hypothetical protein
MFTSFLRLAAGLIFLMIAMPLCAQMPGDSTGFNVVLFKLFGGHDNFSVSARLQILDSMQKPTVDMPYAMSVMSGKMRADIDMNAVSGPMITPEIKAQMKAAGMDRVVSIVRLDTNRKLVIYPALKSCADMALDATTNAASGYTTTKTPMTRETLDGHPCVKYRVVIKDPKGRQQQLIDWEASDMKDFPIRIQLNEDGQNTVIQYTAVKFAKPDPAFFELPAGYARYTNVNSMLARLTRPQPAATRK